MTHANSFALFSGSALMNHNEFELAATGTFHTPAFDKMLTDLCLSSYSRSSTVSQICISSSALCRYVGRRRRPRPGVPKPSPRAAPEGAGFSVLPGGNRFHLRSHVVPGRMLNPARLGPSRTLFGHSWFGRRIFVIRRSKKQLERVCLCNELV